MKIYLTYTLSHPFQYPWQTLWTHHDTQNPSQPRILPTKWRWYKGESSPSSLDLMGGLRHWCWELWRWWAAAGFWVYFKCRTNGTCWKIGYGVWEKDRIKGVNRAFGLNRDQRCLVLRWGRWCRDGLEVHVECSYLDVVSLRCLLDILVELTFRCGL